MSEQGVMKQKVDILNIMRRVGATKAKDTADQARKDEYFKALTENVHDAYMEWQSALANFDSAEGKDMVDYYSYRIKASQIRYDYLIKKAKEAQVQ